MRVMVVVLWMWRDEMMDKMRARHRQEGEECQDSTERTDMLSSLAHRSPPLPTACRERTHSAYSAHGQCPVSLKMTILLAVNLSALLAGEQDARWY